MAAARKRRGRVSGLFAGDEESARVWQSVQDFVALVPEGVVVIGGVAVFLHVLSSKRTDLGSEFTHDADFMIDRAALGTVRDLFEVTVNKRLQMYQVEYSDVEFDIYLERQHHLRVDYAELAMAADDIEGLRVAHKQHLMLLKLAAYKDRGSSAHGKKDSRDLTKLMVLSAKDALLPSALFSEEDLALLERALEDGLVGLTRGNLHQAGTLRKEARKFLARVAKAL